MPISSIVNNIGVGKVEATFWNLTTSNLASYGGTAAPFTEALMDAGNNAASLVAPLEVGYHTETTAPLFGCVVGLSANENGNGFPEKCAVQVSGIAEMRGTTGAIGAPVTNPSFIAAQRGGLVACDTTSGVHALRQSRGRVIMVHAGPWVDVLF